MTLFARIIASAVLAFFPVVAFAVDGLEKVLLDVGKLVSMLTPILIGLALLAFFWGLAMYLLNFNGEEKEKTKGRDVMLYGVITLFVVVSVWGLVAILQQTFGLSGANNPSTMTIPCIIKKADGSCP